MKVVCFGGGSGVPKLVMRPLKEIGFEVVGITSMVDNGGSTGALRKEFDVLPPGDIRRHLLALADLPPEERWKEKLWELRFGKDIEFSPGHYGHSFANVFIAGLEYVLGDFEKALEIAHEFLRVKGKALPATLDKVQLVAELEDGSIVEGEDEIDCGTNHDRRKRIVKVFLEPEGKVYEKAVEEVKKADAIIIGPGDLYTSLISCFLSKGMKEAIQSSRAKKVFISPAMTKLGETHGFNVLDYVREVEKYIGCELDFVIYNTTMPPRERLEEFRKKEPLMEDMVSFENVPQDEKFVGRDLLLEEGDIKYDSEKLVKVLLEVLQK